MDRRLVIFFSTRFYFVVVLWRLKKQYFRMLQNRTESFGGNPKLRLGTNHRPLEYEITKERFA